MVYSCFIPIQTSYDENRFGDMLNTFWQEFEDFHNKQNRFANKNHIWTSSDVRFGNSHFWHFKNSLRYTKILGKFACRVCSKILGIGSAERSWGDVKHLKTNKRLHLSAETTKKQATIYGAYCMEKASMYGQLAKAETDGGPVKCWTDEDFGRQFNMFKDYSDEEEEERSKKQVRFFKAWEEEWEAEAIGKKDPVSVAKLLAKYGGLFFWDEDTEQILYTEPTELDWRKRRGKNKSGYVLPCYPEDFDKDDSDAKDNIEYWEFVDDLRYCICEYYKKHTKLGVQVIEQNAEEEEDVEEPGEQTQSTLVATAARADEESKYH